MVTVHVIDFCIAMLSSEMLEKQQECENLSFESVE